MLAALLAAVVFAQAPAAEAGTRVVLLPLDTAGQVLEPELAPKLAARGLVVVDREAVLGPLRAAAMVAPAWRDAEAARTRGLQAEQDLDLARARSELTAARDALAGQGASFVDPEHFAALLAELARVEDEQGDGSAADETLRAWAALPVPPLDERSFPPSLVVRAVRARTQVAPRPAQLPVEWVWQSRAVDAAITLQTAGPSGGLSAVMLWYPRGEHAPLRTAAAAFSQDPAARGVQLERALDVLAPRPAPPKSAAPEVPEAAHEVVLGASFVFPSFSAYSKSGIDTFGLGLALVGRYVPDHGPAFGGRLDLTWGGVDTKQATFTARWRVARGNWRFSVEPGVGLLVRQRWEDQAMGGSVRVTDFGLVLESGGYIAYRAGDIAEIEEGLTLGVVPLSGSYEVNLPAAVRTTVAFAF